MSEPEFRKGDFVILDELGGMTLHGVVCSDSAPGEPRIGNNIFTTDIGMWVADELTQVEWWPARRVRKYVCG